MWDLKTMPDFTLNFSCTPTDNIQNSLVLKVTEEIVAAASELNRRDSRRCCPRYESRTYYSWHGSLWFAWGDVGQRAGHRDLQPSMGSLPSLSAYCILTFIRSSSGVLMKETALTLCSRAVLEQSVRAPEWHADETECLRSDILSWLPRWPDKYLLRLEASKWLTLSDLLSKVWLTTAEKEFF